MNDPMIIAGALVLVIGALTASIVSIINAQAKMRTELATITRATETIEHHVNGMTTRAEDKRISLEDQINTLKITITKMDDTASTLAKAVTKRLEILDSKIVGNP